MHIKHIQPSDIAGIDRMAFASELVKGGNAKRDVGKLVLVASDKGAYVERREVFAMWPEHGSVGRQVVRARTGQHEIVVALVSDAGVELRRMDLGAKRAGC